MAGCWKGTNYTLVNNKFKISNKYNSSTKYQNTKKLFTCLKRHETSLDINDSPRSDFCRA